MNDYSFMNDETIKRLIYETHENQVIDFKTDFYDFSGNNKIEKEEKYAKFIKDIVSFANTIRTSTAYILIGVDANTKEIKGIDESNILDDASLQQIIKDKVFPIPHFSFYTHEFEEKTIGIVEIPIVKYPTPCVAMKNMKGLESEKVYHRQGSSNSLADSNKEYEIRQWLKSLSNAEEYIQNVLPSFTIIEQRNILLVFLLWFIVLGNIMLSELFQYKVPKTVDFVYILFATYVTIWNVFFITIKYFTSHEIKKKLFLDNANVLIVCRVFVFLHSIGICNKIYYNDASTMVVFIALSIVTPILLLMTSSEFET